MQSGTLPASNPFAPLIDPQIVLSAVDRSEKLAALVRRVHRTFEEAGVVPRGRLSTLQDICDEGKRASALDTLA